MLENAEKYFPTAGLPRQHCLALSVTSTNCAIKTTLIVDCSNSTDISIG